MFRQTLSTATAETQWIITASGRSTSTWDKQRKSFQIHLIPQSIRPKTNSQAHQKESKNTEFPRDPPQDANQGERGHHNDTKISQYKSNNKTRQTIRATRSTGHGKERNYKKRSSRRQMPSPRSAHVKNKKIKGDLGPEEECIPLFLAGPLLGCSTRRRRRSSGLAARLRLGHDLGLFDDGRSLAIVSCAQSRISGDIPQSTSCGPCQSWPWACRQSSSWWLSSQQPSWERPSWQ